jgi:AcrR family transcriptional regulator
MMATISDRKMDLLVAAGALFSKWGYHGTTVRDLARELDVQGGSIYAHIESKEDLLWEIVDIVATKFQQMAAAIPADQGPRQRIESLIRGHLETVASELHFATVFFNEWTCLSDKRRARIAERRDEYEAVFRRTIEQGVRQGVFRVEQPKFAAIYLLSVLNWSHQWFRPGATLRIDQVADYFGELTLRALGASSRGG